MRSTDSLQKVVAAIELVVAVLLVAVAILGTAALVMQMVDAVSAHPWLTHDEIVGLLDTVLVVFIVIELFKIAVAYLRHEDVIPTVMEAALVAVVRKLVVFEIGPDHLSVAGALSILTLSIAGAWFLLSRSTPGARKAAQPSGSTPPTDEAAGS